MLETSFLLEAF